MSPLLFHIIKKCHYHFAQPQQHNFREKLLFEVIVLKHFNENPVSVTSEPSPCYDYYSPPSINFKGLTVYQQRRQCKCNTTKNIHYLYHDIDISNVMDVSVHVSAGYRNITFVGKHFSKTDGICQFTKCIYPRYVESCLKDQILIEIF